MTETSFDDPTTTRYKYTNHSQAGRKIKMHFRQKLRRKILQEDKKCVYCDSYESLVVDHFIPVSRRFEYWMIIGQANSYDNLVTACKSCDAKKRSMKPEDFFSRYPKYRGNFVKNYGSRRPEYKSERILFAVGLTSL